MISPQLGTPPDPHRASPPSGQKPNTRLRAAPRAARGLRAFAIAHSNPAQPPFESPLTARGRPTRAIAKPVREPLISAIIAKGRFSNQSALTHARVAH